MSKHTPWHAGGQNKCTIYDKFGQRVGNTFEGVMAIQRTDEECQQAAMLFAAAPDLLEALKAAREFLALEGSMYVHDICDAAIRKATGEQS